MTIASEITRLRNAITANNEAIARKGVVATGAKIEEQDSLIDQISTGGVVGTGTYLVRFFDYTGELLKQQRVNSGESATPPTLPTHQYLTFAEWNNPFTNVTEDVDTGALYNTTDGKSYLFITLNPITGLSPTLYFRKFTNSLMTIEWGDGLTDTNSVAVTNQSITHTYAAYGNYVITVDNSLGGTYYFGDNILANQILGVGTYRGALTRLFLGLNVIIQPTYLVSYSSLEFVSLGSSITVNASAIFQNCNNLNGVVLPTSTTLTSSMFTGCSNIKYIIFPQTFTSSNFVEPFLNCYARLYTKLNNSTVNIGYGFYQSNISVEKAVVNSSVTSIGNTAFMANYNCCCYLVYPTVPPTLGTTVFLNINSQARIFVPDASVTAYKEATGWIAYANYIYPLSTYIAQ